MSTRSAKTKSVRVAAQDVLFEIGTEELPAAYIPDLLTQLNTSTKQKLSEQHLSFGDVRAYATPRRLILCIDGLSASQAIPAEDVRGPAKAAAFDAQGKPTPALQGFLRSRNSTQAQTKIVSVDKKGEYVYLSIPASTRPSAAILPEILSQIIGSLRTPKAMRWDATGTRFARPVRWLAAMSGTKPLAVRYGALKSAASTWVGLPLKPRKVSFASIPGYFAKLKTAGIIYDHTERHLAVNRMVRAAAQKIKGKPCAELMLYGLDIEVCFLTESPNAFVGQFDAKYLSLPREVLLASMSKHQRVFAIEDSSGKLLPKFVAVLDGKTAKPAAVQRTFERILNARLTDSLFFWNQDHQRHLPLGKGDLSGVAMHAKLGSMKEKTERLRVLGALIAAQWQLDAAQKQTLEAASGCAKHDLLTTLVREFPTLQGVMGKYYALDSGLGPDVAKAVEEHYLPLAGKRPESVAGSALALIDKYDTLAAYFSVGIEPTGDQDPFGLRRAAQGIVEIVWMNQKPLAFAALFEAWSQAMEQTLKVKPNPDVAKRVQSYLLDRLYSFGWPDRKAGENGEAPTRDIIDAVLASPQSAHDLWGVMQRACSLKQMSGRPELLEAAKIIERTRNMLRSAKLTQSAVESAHLTEPAEQRLYKALEEQGATVGKLAGAGSYQEATAAFAKAFSEPLHTFFAEVMVNVPDERVKQNRLALMQAIQALYTDRVADLSKLTLLQPQHEESR